MKTIARISAITALLSLAGLESHGAWAWLVLAVGLAAVVVLFAACSRLGYFETRGVDTGDARVFSLEERRRATSRESTPQGTAAGQASWR